MENRISNFNCENALRYLKITVLVCYLNPETKAILSIWRVNSFDRHCRVIVYQLKITWESKLNQFRNPWSRRFKIQDGNRSRSHTVEVQNKAQQKGNHFMSFPNITVLENWFWTNWWEPLQGYDCRVGSQWADVAPCWELSAGWWVQPSNKKHQPTHYPSATEKQCSQKNTKHDFLWERK